jgi:hypothetical protein
MLVKPAPPKHRINETEDKLIITIPGLRIWPLIFVFSVWSIMWLFFEITILVSVFSGKTGVSGAVLVVVWSILGVFLLYNLIWLVASSEEIQITETSIRLNQVVLGYTRSKEYLAEHIKDLELAYISTKEINAGRFMLSNTGLISFDYGAKTYRFADAIEKAEAKQIISKIQNKFPQYKKKIQE